MAVLCSLATAVQAYPQLYVFSDSLIDTGINGQFTDDSNKNLLYAGNLAAGDGNAMIHDLSVGWTIK